MQNYNKYLTYANYEQKIPIFFCTFQKNVVPLQPNWIIKAVMTFLSHSEKESMMKDMKSFDEPMPSVGVFWYDPQEHDFFGVYKKELTPKMVEDAADKGIKVINYEEPNHRQNTCGRVSWNIDRFVVFVGQWAKDIEGELTTLIEKYFALPYFEFRYDEHWDLGRGWSGDL